MGALLFKGLLLGPSECCDGYMIMLRSTNVLLWLHGSAED